MGFGLGFGLGNAKKTQRQSQGQTQNQDQSKGKIQLQTQNPADQNAQGRQKSKPFAAAAASTSTRAGTSNGEEHIPILLLEWNTIKRLGRRMVWLGKPLAKMRPTLGTTLAKLGVPVEADAYLVGSLVSSLIYGLVVFVLITLVLLVSQKGDADAAMRMGAAGGLGITAIMFMLHLAYPSIVLKKIAVKENRDLLFALREVMVDVNSGVPLFEAVRNAASADYGYISKDFLWVAQQIESGVSEREALRQLAVKTESEYLKRALWQMVNALESGAALGDALSGIVKSVEDYVYRDIKNYSSNLNFLMLIYMFAAAVVPSLGVTFLVLLSAFSDFGVTVTTVSALVLSSALMQAVLIGYMSSTRPDIFGG